jgi:hypothetical protein
MTLNKILANAKLHPDPLSSDSSHDTFFEAMGRVRNVADQVCIYIYKYTLLIGGLPHFFLFGLATFRACANSRRRISLS